LRFFAPQGRHVAPMGVKFGTEEGTEGPLLHAKFGVEEGTIFDTAMET